MFRITVGTSPTERCAAGSCSAIQQGELQSLGGYKAPSKGLGIPKEHFQWGGRWSWDVPFQTVSWTSCAYFAQLCFLNGPKIAWQSFDAFTVHAGDKVSVSADADRKGVLFDLQDIFERKLKQPSCTQVGSLSEMNVVSNGVPGFRPGDQHLQ